DRLSGRGRRTGSIALGEQAVDVPVVLLFGEQVAALPALAPVILTRIAMEPVGPRFGGNRNAESRGVTEGTVKRVIDDFDFSDGADGWQVGRIAAGTIAERAVDRPHVPANATAVCIVGAALC